MFASWSFQLGDPKLVISLRKSYCQKKSDCFFNTTISLQATLKCSPKNGLDIQKGTLYCKGPIMWSPFIKLNPSTKKGKTKGGEEGGKKSPNLRPYSL